MRGALDIDGVCIRRGAIPGETLATLRREFASASGRPGSRGFNLTDGVSSLIGTAGSLGSLAAGEADMPVRPVRILFFDKTPESNWAVPLASGSQHWSTSGPI